MQGSGVRLEGGNRGHGQGSSGPAWPGQLRRRGSELGMATAEVAILILVTCGFAAVLAAVLGSSEVRGLLTGIVRDALSSR